MPDDSICIPLVDHPSFNHILAWSLALVHLDWSVVYLCDTLLESVHKSPAYRCDLVFVVGIATVTIVNTLNEALQQLCRESHRLLVNLLSVGIVSVPVNEGAEVV